MKEIFQEFGTAIIAIITSILVIGILFGVAISSKQGILEIAGVPLNKSEVDYSSYSDFDSVITWHKRTKPEAAYITSKGRFFWIENVDFLERYYAKDMEGVIYPMDDVIIKKMFPDIMFGKVLDIRKADGTSIISSYSKTDGVICFPSAGIYEVYFQIRDKENLTSIWRISIAADERRSH